MDPRSNQPSDPRGALRGELLRAQGTLRRVAVVEAALGGLVGGLLALGVALILVGVLPFSLGMVWALRALVGVGVTLGAAHFVYHRLLPLRDDAFVADRLEEAAGRSGHELGGAVRGAVELLRQRDDGTSPALAEAHVAWAHQRVAKALAARAILSVGLLAARRTLVSAGVATLSALLVGLLAQGVVAERWAMLFDDDAARATLEERARNLLPLVTDLTLTLRFPAYMARPDQTIRGASGDVVAPRGTEVWLEGRADRIVRAAAIVYGEALIALEVEGGRNLKGHFVVDVAGAYRFRLEGPKGDTELGPVAHRVTLVPDEVPRVELLAPDADATVQVDEVIPLGFQASDDYGLTRFKLVVRRQGSGRPPWEKDVLVLESTVKEKVGQATFSPQEAGARAGERLSLHIEAYDNDTVSGPKSGRTVTRVLTVFSAAEHHRELIDLQQQLQDTMVELLGDELEAEVPARVSEDEEARKRLVASQDPALSRGEELMKLMDRVLEHLGKDDLSPKEVRRALANMRVDIERPWENKSELVRNAKSAVASKTPVLDYVFRHLRTYQRELVGKLEKHILYLDDLLLSQRLAEAQQIAEDMKRTQEGLKELIEQYKKAPDDATRETILEEIRRLQEQMRQLMKRLNELQRDVPDEYLNQEAFDQEHMAESAMDLDKMIEEGRLDDALKSLQSMIESTEQMLKGMEETREEYGDDEYKELRDKMRDFGEELKSLKAEQEELAHRTQRMLESAQKEAMRRMEGELKQTLERLKKKTKQAKKELSEVDPRGLFGPEQEDASLAGSRLDDLEAALEAGDIEDALEAVREAEAAARGAERAVSDRTRGRWGSKNDKTLEARGHLEQARPLIEEVHDELDQLMPDPAALLSEPQRQQLQKDAKRQSDLKDRADQLAQKMQAIGEEMPVFGPSHQQQVGRAGQKMREAGKRLSREDLRRGRSAQQQALHALGELEEALQQMAQQGGQSGGIPLPLPGGAGQEPGRESGNGRQSADEPVKIPGAEEFQVPDAFRRDILDAMREDAPEEWQGEVKQYYEDLVK